MIYVHFCSTCGTNLFLTFERFDGLVGSYAGTFDDPDWMKLDMSLVHWQFLDDAPQGVEIPQGVPVYRQHSLNPDGSVRETMVFDKPFVIGKSMFPQGGT